MAAVNVVAKTAIVPVDSPTVRRDVNQILALVMHLFVELELREIRIITSVGSLVSAVHRRAFVVMMIVVSTSCCYG